MQAIKTTGWILLSGLGLVLVVGLLIVWVYYFRHPEVIQEECGQEYIAARGEKDCKDLKTKYDAQQEDHEEVLVF